MLKSHEVATKAIAELTSEMNNARIATSVRKLKGYAGNRCGCQFPESRPPKGRTAGESHRLEKARAAREFALHVCSERGWPPEKRSPTKKPH
jgi:hypothetical protein